MLGVDDRDLVELSGRHQRHRVVERVGRLHGRDVIAHPDPERPIFVSHNHDVGMLVGDKLAVLGLQKTSAVYRYDSITDRQTPLPFDAALVDRATAAYESAFLLFSRGRYR